MPINELSRRALLAGAAPLALLPRAALAQATSRASALVEKLAADFIAALRTASPPARLTQDFAALLGRSGDMPVVAADGLVWWRPAGWSRTRAMSSSSLVARGLWAVQWPVRSSTTGASCS